MVSGTYFVVRGRVEPDRVSSGSDLLERAASLVSPTSHRVVAEIASGKRRRIWNLVEDAPFAEEEARSGAERPVACR
jgi:hypothetical protein